MAAELGQGTLAIAADVTDRHAVVAAANRIELDLGCADVLINNAGVMLLGPFGSGQREEARRMVEVNLLGAITATEVFLGQLRNGGGDWSTSPPSPDGPPAPATPPTRRRSGA
jgi:NADP-dependent 3-hydroxy acid dehydrogenase YdfG